MMQPRPARSNPNAAAPLPRPGHPAQCGQPKLARGNAGSAPAPHGRAISNSLISPPRQPATERTCEVCHARAPPTPRATHTCVLSASTHQPRAPHSPDGRGHIAPTADLNGGFTRRAAAAADDGAKGECKGQGGGAGGCNEAAVRPQRAHEATHDDGSQWGRGYPGRVAGEGQKRVTYKFPTRALRQPACVTRCERALAVAGSYARAFPGPALHYDWAAMEAK